MPFEFSVGMADTITIFRSIFLYKYIEWLLQQKVP